MDLGIRAEPRRGSRLVSVKLRSPFGVRCSFCSRGVVSQVSKSERKVAKTGTRVETVPGRGPELIETGRSSTAGSI